MGKCRGGNTAESPLLPPSVPTLSVANLLQCEVSELLGLQGALRPGVAEQWLEWARQMPAPVGTHSWEEGSPSKPLDETEPWQSGFLQGLL